MTNKLLQKIGIAFVAVLSIFVIAGCATGGGFQNPTEQQIVQANVIEAAQVGTLYVIQNYPQYTNELSQAATLLSNLTGGTNQLSQATVVAELKQGNITNPLIITAISSAVNTANIAFANSTNAVVKNIIATDVINWTVYGITNELAIY